MYCPAITITKNKNKRTVNITSCYENKMCIYIWKIIVKVMSNILPKYTQTLHTYLYTYIIRVQEENSNNKED